MLFNWCHVSNDHEQLLCLWVQFYFHFVRNPSPNTSTRLCHAVLDSFLHVHEPTRVTFFRGLVNIVILCHGSTTLQPTFEATCVQLSTISAPALELVLFVLGRGLCLPVVFSRFLLSSSSSFALSCFFFFWTFLCPRLYIRVVCASPRRHPSGYTHSSVAVF